MSLITKNHLNIVLQTIKKLLSFKADKTEVVLRNEIEDTDAIKLATKAGLVSPAAAEDDCLYIDKNGNIYSL